MLVGTERFAIGNPWGVLLAVVAVMFALSSNVMLRRIPERYNPLTIIFYTQLVSFVLFCGLWAFTDMRSETVTTVAQGVLAAHFVAFLTTVFFSAAFFVLLIFIILPCYLYILPETYFPANGRIVSHIFQKSQWGK